MKLGFVSGVAIKNPPVHAGDVGDAGLIPGSGRFPGEGNGNPLQSSCWKIPWTGELGGCSPWGRRESDTTERLSSSSGNSLSVLNQPRDRMQWNLTIQALPGGTHLMTTLELVIFFFLIFI